jgi:hypothetical protein
MADEARQRARPDVLSEISLALQWTASVLCQGPFEEQAASPDAALHVGVLTPQIMVDGPLVKPLEVR